MWLTLDSICSQCAELTLHKLILYWKDFHFHQFFKYFVNFDRFILIKRWVKGKLAFSSFFCVSFGFVTKTRLFNILLSVFFSSRYSQHWYHFSWLLLFFYRLQQLFLEMDFWYIFFFFYTFFFIYIENFSFCRYKWPYLIIAQICIF